MAPGSTSTPATRDVSRSFILAIGPVDTTLSTLTVATALVTSRLACSPVAVTTIASSEYGSTTSLKSCAATSATVMVTTRDATPYPIAVTRTVAWPGGTPTST